MSVQRRKRRSRRLGSRVTSAVLAILTVFALLLVVLALFARPGKDGVSRLAGHPILTVLSGSMRPMFRPGDLVVDKPVTATQAADLAPGAVITFRVPGTASDFITHRIVAVEHNTSGISYRTKGVANNAVDPEPVKADQVVGLYQRRVPFGGYVLQAVEKKAVFFLLILLPLLYLGGTELTRWLQRKPATGDDAEDSEPTLLVDERETVPASVASPDDALVRASGQRGEGEHRRE